MVGSQLANSSHEPAALTTWEVSEAFEPLGTRCLSALDGWWCKSDGRFECFGGRNNRSRSSFSADSCIEVDIFPFAALTLQSQVLLRTLCRADKVEMRNASGRLMQGLRQSFLSLFAHSNLPPFVRSQDRMRLSRGLMLFDA